MTPRGHRRQSGSVLVGVLLIALLMTSMCMAFARHAVLTASAAEAAVAVQVAEGAADSGLAWARQALLSGVPGGATLPLDGDAQVRVDVADDGAGRGSLSIASSARGQSQSLAGTLETYATVGGGLPQLTDAARAAVRLDATRTEISGDQSLSNTTLTGVILLRNGASLTLTNCIVAGTLVSEPALSAIGWQAADATRIRLAGTVVIESDPLLAGCSIIAPDASVTGLGGQGVQVRGAIVCASLSLPGWGALHGPLASSSPPVLTRAMELPGSGRAPRAWPAALDTGATGVARVVFPRLSATQAEQDAIERFGFPSRARPAEGAGR